MRGLLLGVTYLSLHLGKFLLYQQLVCIILVFAYHN